MPGCDPQLQELVLAELDDFQPTAIQEAEEILPAARVLYRQPMRATPRRERWRVSFARHLFVESLDVDDEDWAARSQAQLRAVTVGRLVIAPRGTRGRESFSRLHEKDTDPLLRFSSGRRWGLAPAIIPPHGWC